MVGSRPIGDYSSNRLQQSTQGWPWAARAPLRRNERLWRSTNIRPRTIKNGEPPLSSYDSWSISLLIYATSRADLLRPLGLSPVLEALFGSGYESLPNGDARQAFGGSSSRFVAGPTVRGSAVKGRILSFCQHKESMVHVTYANAKAKHGGHISYNNYFPVSFYSYPTIYCTQ